jgi:hypothetical protein
MTEPKPCADVGRLDTTGGPGVTPDLVVNLSSNTTLRNKLRHHLHMLTSHQTKSYTLKNHGEAKLTKIRNSNLLPRVMMKLFLFCGDILGLEEVLHFLPSIASMRPQFGG